MWISRQTATQLTIWRTLNLPFAQLRSWLSVSIAIAIFLVWFGSFGTVTCYRAGFHSPVHCDVTTGILIQSSTAAYDNVSGAVFKSGGRYDTYTTIDHA